MRALLAGTNITGASSDYPKGRVRDKIEGVQAGTIPNEVLFGDIIQHFQKLIIDAGITENGNPDNVTNGYQLLEALQAKIRATLASTSNSGSIEIATPDEVLSGSSASLAVTPDGFAKSVGITSFRRTSNGTYNFSEKVGLMFVASGITSLTINLPSAPANRNKKIVIISEGAISGANVFDGDLVLSLSAGYIHEFYNNGSKWFGAPIVQLTNAELACPYVYVNGLYIEEILKNIMNEDGEETIDLSKSMDLGHNVITITEEKDEITFVKELYFNDVLIDSDFILNKGDKREYEVQFDGINANLRAVGHYKKL